MYNQGMAVRVRFAPSPTGSLHIGGARTALFNWLFARNQKGIFILRIEDTDEVRSTEESLKTILRSLSWLGLDWDEGPVDAQKSKGDFGPYFQMQRLDLYKKHIQILLEKKFLYSCFCSPQELEAMRKEQALRKQPPKYDGRCRELSEEEKRKREAEGKKSVLRFKMPSEGRVEFEDIVRGQVSFENALLDDFVVTKSSGIPTYNFACVVDDHLMEISHVIRGDDHLSNTPRQAHLYQAFGWTPPQFAHIPMILGQDGGRLSKRHGAESVLEYKEAGYLPWALVNYLSLLGWATSDSQQIFEKEDLIQKFALERCSKSPAIWDPAKILWMNGEYIRKASADELVELVWPYLLRAGLISEKTDRHYALRALALEQEKFKRLSEVPALLDFFFKEDFEYRSQAVEKTLSSSGAREALSALSERLEKVHTFEAGVLEALFRAFAKERGLKMGEVFHPARVAVSGRTEGPSLFGMLEVLGKERVLARLRRAISLCAV